VRYEVQGHLGAGGQASVDRATDIVLNRPVAIKSLEPYFGVAPSDRDRERLKREARALASLSHPNIPAVYDIQLDTAPPRIIFEFIDGDNLLSILNARKPTLREVCRWLRQVCAALAHAHARGIIHRDVKPANIVLRPRVGSCYLVDFGLATIPGEALRSSSKLGGTPAYMSPEQLRGEELDPRSDIYSLAVTMYQLLANKLPAPERYEQLSSIDHSIPPEVDALIQDCLGSKATRPADADEFARRLGDAVSISMSMSEILDHGKLLQRIIETVENPSPENLPIILGDLRVLRLRLGRLQSLVTDGQVSLRDLGVDSGASVDAMIIPLEDAVNKFRREYVAEVLDRFRGNRTQAAHALGVDVRTVFRYLKKGDENRRGR
jgi:serine/threonine-protein kinase